MKNNDKYVEAKKYLQKRYPKELSDKRWNTSDVNDDWVTEMMTDFASQSKPQEKLFERILEFLKNNFEGTDREFESAAIEFKKEFESFYPQSKPESVANIGEISDNNTTIKSVTLCPTCGSECEIGVGDSGSHYYIPKSKPQEIPEENRQKLFNHMSTEHGLTLLESEMDSIYSICIGHEEYVKYLNWLHSKPVDTKTVDAVDTTFWRRLEMFVSNIQVNDVAGEEEKQYIIRVIESKK